MSAYPYGYRQILKKIERGGPPSPKSPTDLLETRNWRLHIMLPHELNSLIAEYACEPTYELSDLGGNIDPSNLEEDEVAMLCANPHPGISSILEPYVERLDDDMWDTLSKNPGAFDLLNKYRDKLPNDLVVDWAYLKEKREDIVNHIGNYMDETYWNDDLQNYGINCVTADELKLVNTESLQFGRGDYESLVSHEWIVRLIENGILHFGAFKCKHQHYIFEHPDMIWRSNTLNKESHAAWTRTLEDTFK